MSKTTGNASLLPQGFMPIRHGLRQHIKNGRFTLTRFAVYVFLLLEADWFTGIYRGTASGIAYAFGDPGQVRTVLKALAKLRDQKYVNYPDGSGRRGSYPILINKYLVTVGALLGTRLNAFASSDFDHPKYEPWNGEGAQEVAQEVTQEVAYIRKAKTPTNTEELEHLIPTAAVSLESISVVPLRDATEGTLKGVDPTGPTPIAQNADPPAQPAQSTAQTTQNARSAHQAARKFTPEHMDAAGKLAARINDLIAEPVTDADRYAVAGLLQKHDPNEVTAALEFALRDSFWLSKLSPKMFVRSYATISQQYRKSKLQAPTRTKGVIVKSGVSSTGYKFHGIN